jgi:hypothetical protein
MLLISERQKHGNLQKSPWKTFNETFNDFFNKRLRGGRVACLVWYVADSGKNRLKRKLSIFKCRIFK